MTFKTPLKLICFAFLFFLTASCGSLKFLTKPKLSIQLAMQQPNGTNGTAVAFNPDKKVYYAVMGGHHSYPLETFHKKGKAIFQSESYCDARGMWWNTGKKQIERNIYKGGIKQTKPPKKGVLIGSITEVLIDSLTQPDPNSCAVWDEQNQSLWYYHQGIFYQYDYQTSELLLEQKIDLPCPINDITAFSLIYTNIPNEELGLLNFQKKEVYLFDKNTFELKRTITLPTDAPTDAYFGFAYANSHVFLFDKGSRTWVGYQILK